VLVNEAVGLQRREALHEAGERYDAVLLVMGARRGRAPLGLTAVALRHGSPCPRPSGAPLEALAETGRHPTERDELDHLNRDRCLAGVRQRPMDDADGALQTEAGSTRARAPRRRGRCRRW